MRCYVFLSDESLCHYNTFNGVVGSRSLCSWAGLNEAIQDQSILTHVFYVTIIIMHNMHAHLLTLAKMATLPRLVQNCFKQRNALLEQ